jgi:8-oxo-dGTP diphosphatase
MAYTYQYPMAAVTADVILINEAKTQVLLIKRAKDPFANYWAFPGGFMEMNETLLEAAVRELKEETSLVFSDLKFFCMADTPNRDPRGRTISAVFWSICASSEKPIAADDAAEVAWFELNNLPLLAFDHQQLIDSFKRDILLK